jgi:hypothetical protein
MKIAEYCRRISEGTTEVMPHRVETFYKDLSETTLDDHMSFEDAVKKIKDAIKEGIEKHTNPTVKDYLKNNEKQLLPEKEDWNK